MRPRLASTVVTFTVQVPALWRPTPAAELAISAISQDEIEALEAEEVIRRL